MVINAVKCGWEKRNNKNCRKFWYNYVALRSADTPSSSARKAPAIFMNS